MSRHFDLAVVGAGIVGLAHALAAVRRGLRVVVIDREREVIGASVRNFGFVTVTGQQQGECWRRALRSRDVWLEVAPQAGIAIEQEGLLVVAQRPEALAVLEAFAATEMGAACRLVDGREARSRYPVLGETAIAGVLWSPHERRIESRDAIPKLADWLERALGVTFVRDTLVKDVAPPYLATTAGTFGAERVVVCPGDDLLTLYADRIRALGIGRCRLHMLKVRPGDPGFCLPAAAMSDLSLIRYLGYAELPETAALKARLEAEQPRMLAHGIHLIAVQGRDRDLIVGDSHHYEWSPSPFAEAGVDELILAELTTVLRLPEAYVTERWTGIYASLPDRLVVIDAPEPAVRLVMVTSGTGASTAFAIGEEVIADLFGGI
ncbi:MAG TPA: TIGR03364 family FAD-dependent oxidoreductase [Geminicoccaceae bacterium]|nr:TIGR03364 family FAD-dependent oxidoreductase [Geminicoccaceae bacterium]